MGVVKKSLLFRLIILTLLSFILFAGCTVSSQEKQIREFIDTRLIAIQEGDLYAYMATVDSSDSYYVNEQRS